jgi:hypothetical protein
MVLPLHDDAAIAGLVDRWTTLTLRVRVFDGAK